MVESQEKNNQPTPSTFQETTYSSNNLNNAEASENEAFSNALAKKDVGILKKELDKCYLEMQKDIRTLAKEQPVMALLFSVQTYALENSSQNTNFNNFNNLAEYAVTSEYTIRYTSQLPENDPSKAKPGKIYLSNSGEYVFRDPVGHIHKGTFNENIIQKFELNNIENKFPTPEYPKRAILEIPEIKSAILENVHTTVSKDQTFSNKFLNTAKKFMMAYEQSHSHLNQIHSNLHSKLDDETKLANTKNIINKIKVDKGTNSTFKKFILNTKSRLNSFTEKIRAFFNRNKEKEIKIEISEPVIKRRSSF